MDDDILIIRPFVDGKTLPRKVRREFFSVCWKKAAYKTEAIALEFSKRAEKERNIKTVIYQCKFCSGFHLSSVKG